MMTCQRKQNQICLQRTYITLKGNRKQQRKEMQNYSMCRLGVGKKTWRDKVWK